MVTAQQVLGLFDEALNDEDPGKRMDAYRILNDIREELGLRKSKMIAVYWYLSGNDMDYGESHYVFVQYFTTLAERVAYVEALRYMKVDPNTSLHLSIGFKLRHSHNVDNPYRVQVKDVIWEYVI